MTNATRSVRLPRVDIVLVDKPLLASSALPQIYPTQSGSLEGGTPSFDLSSEYEFLGSHHVVGTKGRGEFYRNTRTNALINLGVVPIFSLVQQPESRGQLPTQGEDIFELQVGSTAMAMVRTFLMRDGRSDAARPTSRLFFEKEESVVILAGTLVSDEELLDLVGSI